jgi:taspase (threonine aspartase 1)
MNFLRNGATAVDAVEVAIMMMEDAVITNAGYGSNLNVKGVVECDASIVDHFGRSGACGAVPCKIFEPLTTPQLASTLADSIV